MKIFNASQIRDWDKYTIEKESVASIDLMERAARACTKRILQISPPSSSMLVLAGPGNNGGDGFAIARLVADFGRKVRVIQFSSSPLSEDCRKNRERWLAGNHQLTDILQESDLPQQFEDNPVIIDAIFGTGQNRPVEGIVKLACEKINAAGLTIISIDVPTGINCDQSQAGNTHIRASYTLSFQGPKLCFFMPENHEAFGHIEYLDIGLSDDYLKDTPSVFSTLGKTQIQHIIRPRNVFAHKGQFGLALLLAGSHGMMGAALLAAEACLRAGAGKLFCAIPSDGLAIFQSSIREAICIPDTNLQVLERLPGNLDQYSAIGAGPGIGKRQETRTLIRNLLTITRRPLVLDADALNIIAEENMLKLLPGNTVITPHIGEFTRLFGPSANDFERVNLAVRKAIEYRIYIVLKGRYTLIATPEGRGYFNTTGNPGMAKAGSGDVLTGIITGLLAQSYSTEDACTAGVFIHGMAGDLARDILSEQSVLASDIIAQTGPAFRKLELSS